MKMFNASLDKWKCQCESKVFIFNPRETTEVPLNLVPFLYERYKDNGIFPIYPEDTPEQLKVKSREALKAFLYGMLRERILNFTSDADESKRRGITLQPSLAFQRALRQDKEIRMILSIESPLEEELSFFSDEDRKKFGLGESKDLKHIDNSLFDPAIVKAAQENEESKKRMIEENQRAALASENHVKEQNEAIEEALATPDVAPKKRGAPKGGWPKKEIQPEV